jgi:hypothetical protein
MLFVIHLSKILKNQGSVAYVYPNYTQAVLFTTYFTDFF